MAFCQNAFPASEKQAVLERILMKEHTKASIASSILIVLLVALDQWTKYAITIHMKLHQSVEVIKNFFYITYVQNTGAGFSIFENYGKVFFAVLTLIALIAIVYYFYHTQDRKIQFCLTIIFAGAIGNFIDRMTLGYVVDFFSFYFFGWGFPVFNVADICISVGFILLVVISIIDEVKKEKAWKNKQ